MEPDSGVFEKLIEAPFSSSQVLHFDLFTGLGAATWSMVNMGWCSHTVLWEKDQWLRSLAEKRFETEATWKDTEEVTEQDVTTIFDDIESRGFDLQVVIVTGGFPL